MIGACLLFRGQIQKWTCSKSALRACLALRFTAHFFAEKMVKLAQPNIDKPPNWSNFCWSNLTKRPCLELAPIEERSFCDKFLFLFSTLHLYLHSGHFYICCLKSALWAWPFLDLGTVSLLIHTNACVGNTDMQTNLTVY
jgi:hypothetical protein